MHTIFAFSLFARQTKDHKGPQRTLWGGFVSFFLILPFCPVHHPIKTKIRKKIVSIEIRGQSKPLQLVFQPHSSSVYIQYMRFASSYKFFYRALLRIPLATFHWLGSRDLSDFQCKIPIVRITRQYVGNLTRGKTHFIFSCESRANKFFTYCDDFSSRDNSVRFLYCQTYRFCLILFISTFDRNILFLIHILCVLLRHS